MKLEVSFSDFWRGFDPENSVVWQLLADTFELSLVENGQLHFFSSYGNTHLSRIGRKIFFSAENEAAPRFACDFSIGQRKPSSSHHLYFPLWLIYYFFQTRNGGGMPTRPPLEGDWLQRGDVCSVISNDASTRRRRILEALGASLTIAHGGRVLNNVGSPVVDKAPFLRQHKFHVALENSIGDGYVTEKIFDAFVASCIPVYWGSRGVFDFFNSRAFVFVANDRVADAANRVRQLLSDPAQAYEMTRQPLFREGFDPEHWIEDLRRLLVGNARKAHEPRARANAAFRHAMARAEYKVNIVKYYARRAARQTFR